MKNFYILFFALIVSLVKSQNNYQKSFSQGFSEGYCYGVIAGCVAPVAPIAPVDIKMDAKTGYNNGFVAGRNAKLAESRSTYSGGSSQTTSFELPDPSPERSAMYAESWERYRANRRAKKENKKAKEEIGVSEVYQEYQSTLKEIERTEVILKEQNKDLKYIKNKLDKARKDSKELYDKFILKAGQYERYKALNSLVLMELRKRD